MRKKLKTGCISIVFVLLLPHFVYAQQEFSETNVSGGTHLKEESVTGKVLQHESTNQAVITDVQPSRPVEHTQSDLEALIRKLSSPDPSERVKAIQEIGTIGQQAVPAIPSLVDMLGDTESVTFYTGSIPALPTSAAKESLTVLVQIGKPGVESLISALKDRNSEVRKNAAEALGQMNDARAVEPLIKVSRVDDDTTARKNAIEALGNIKDARAVEPVLELLNDRRTVIQNASFDALAKLAEAAKERLDLQTLSVILENKNMVVRQLAITKLAEIPRRESAELLIPYLGDQDMSIRNNITEALKKIGEPAADPLVQALKNDDISTVITAVVILGDFKEKRAAEPMSSLLHYQSEDRPLEAAKLRAETANSLGKIGDAHAVQSLIAALKDEYPPVRERAKWALIEIGEPAVEPLTKALHNFDPGIQVNIAKILGEIKDPSAVEPLIQALLVDAAKDQSWLFRFEAARALGKIKDTRAIEPLNILLEDRVSYVRDMAQWAITQISGTEVDKKRDSWWKKIFD